LFKAASDLVRCCASGEHPPRKYKASGVAKDGSTFQPYLRLVLYHHHLHACGDPLLVTQHIGDIAYGVALTTHAKHFGDKWQWLREHEAMIDWELSEDILEQLRAKCPNFP
jgi:hypothetical protein